MRKQIYTIDEGKSVVDISVGKNIIFNRGYFLDSKKGISINKGAEVVIVATSGNVTTIEFDGGYRMDIPNLITIPGLSNMGR